METKSNKEAHSIIPLENAEKDGAESLLTQMLNRDNINKAYKKVKKNGGSAGIDNKTVEEMLP